MKNAQKRELRQAGVSYEVYSFKSDAVNALNELDDLLAHWEGNLYLDDSHNQVVSNIKTIEQLRVTYLKRLLGE
jgi:hypothetical protein